MVSLLSFGFSITLYTVEHPPYFMIGVLKINFSRFFEFPGHRPNVRCAKADKNLTTKCYDLRRPIAADYEQLYALPSIIVNAGAVAKERRNSFGVLS